MGVRLCAQHCLRLSWRYFNGTLLFNTFSGSKNYVIVASDPVSVTGDGLSSNRCWTTVDKGTGFLHHNGQEAPGMVKA